MFYTLNCNKREKLEEQLLCSSTFQRCLHIFSVLVASWQQARSHYLIFWCRAAWPKSIWPEKALWQDHFGTGHVSTVGKRILIHIASIFIKFWRHATHRSYSKELIHHCNGDSYPMTVNFVSLSEGIVHYVSSSSNSFMWILAKRSFSAPKPHWQK